MKWFALFLVSIILVAAYCGCASVGYGPNGNPTCWAGPFGHASYTVQSGPGEEVGPTQIQAVECGGEKE